MTRNKVLLAWLALIGLAILLFLPRESSDEVQPVLLQGKTMGTTFNVKFYPTSEQLQTNNMYELVNDELIRVNQLMSTYIEDSELSVLNKTPMNKPMVVSADNVVVLNEAQRLYKASDGAFDVTVGPLVNLWGFGPDGRVVKQPPADTIEDMLTRIGTDLLDIQGNTVTKKHDNVYIDFSALAKGYGVDRVAHVLEQLGITNYLVEIGGEMRLSGAKPDGTKWRVAIEKPIAGSREVQLILEPQNLAIATSGDYRNYFEVDGKRYSHTIDPRTGYPITHKLVSVTVLHKSSMTADALATMLTVLGPVEAAKYAEENQLPVYLIVKTDSGFQGIMSSQFEALFPLK
ncbi:MAG: FAD:protein FMN transferase [Glaciecola sp.]|nr:FAD:protein FMN transferase [Glaciecola sp.]